MTTPDPLPSNPTTWGHVRPTLAQWRNVLAELQSRGASGTVEADVLILTIDEEPQP